MSDIAKGVGNLFTSVLEIIKGIFTTIFSVFEGAVSTVIGLFKNVFNLAEGVVGFIIGMWSQRAEEPLKLTEHIGNIFILGTLAAVYFGYILYQQRQGKQPAPISRAATKKTK